MAYYNTSKQNKAIAPNPGKVKRDRPLQNYEVSSMVQSFATVVRLSQVQESESLDIRANHTTYATALDLDLEFSMTLVQVALETRDGRYSAMIDLSTNNESIRFILPWLRERIPARWVVVDTGGDDCEF